eukprot:7955349-Pyramimonas_sp.AAC.1
MHALHPFDPSLSVSHFLQSLAARRAASGLACLGSASSGSAPLLLALPLGLALPFALALAAALSLSSSSFWIHSLPRE